MTPLKITVGLPVDPETPLLIIGPTDRKAIAAALAKAAATPITDPHDPPPDAAQFVDLSAGYSVGFTFEAQPGGLCKHLAVRTDGRTLPNLDAVEMIALEFGIVPGRGVIAFWADHDQMSANILALANPPLS